MNHEPKDSAVILGWGAAILIVGQLIYNIGRQQAIESAFDLYRSDDGSGTTIIGVVVTLAGLICALIGLGVSHHRSIISPSASTHDP